MTSPIERISSLVVGTVESVAPNEIKVLLDLDSPHSTALNSGTPAAFPRLNNYVLIPNEAGATVGYIAWIGIERSPYPKRSGLKDFGLIDLPFPLRKMSISPVGTLTTRRDRASEKTIYELSRGVVAFPSVGDQVLMPTPEQIEAVVGAKESDKRVKLGTSPIAANANIMVDPDKIFGRHLAVLGNTGSGKSCTVAGLIRWSIEAAQKNVSPPKTPNMRFIVLDPNGEYAKAFQDLGEQVRIFRVPPVTDNERALQVPAWMWSGHEWSAVAHAQPGAQRPLLLQGVRELKSGQTEGVPREAIIRRYLVSYSTRISSMLNQGTQAFAGAAVSRFNCARMLQAMANDMSHLAEGLETGTVRTALEALAHKTTGVVEARRSGQYFNDFTISDLETIRTDIDTLTTTLPDFGIEALISEDAPTPFDPNLLATHLERIAVEQGGNLAGFISTLGLRIRNMLADTRLGPVIAQTPAPSFEKWLGDIIGEDNSANGPLAIIDLSLLPSDVIHIVVAVLARVIFEGLQRYRKTNPEGKALPTVLVLEEAHTFVRRGKDDDSGAFSPATLCREAFERIAREGRKFGLGLVLSSQRPSELSPTALAQCNTFLLHRIVNDSDQNLVARLVPDNVGGLLSELPSLPSRQAILLGWATPIPVLVEIGELPKNQRPQSDDPDFWDVWIQKSARSINWKTVVTDWVGRRDATETVAPENINGLL